MQYLCMKQLTAGCVTYYPGDIIPDGAILPERSRKLLRNGYIAELSAENLTSQDDVLGKLFTEEEVNAMIADAVAKAEKAKEEQLAELQKHAAELIETDPEAYESTVQVTVFGEKEDMVMRFSPEEIQQVFSVLQLNAEEGIKVISGVTSENVLILIHATDGRKTIKNAAKEQADKLFTTESSTKAPSTGNTTTDTNPEGS